MNSDTDIQELPIFPASAPEGLQDSAATIELIRPVLESLSVIVEIEPEHLNRPTPCRDYDVGQLRRHVLAWLQFFADALSDPDAGGERIDPDTWELGDGDAPGDSSGEIVLSAAQRITIALEGGVGERFVVMSQARMNGYAVAAMALGEYIVHGWDLATATDRAWTVDDNAATQARLFLETTVAPEYRGEDSGFFGDEVSVADDSSPLEKLLAFAGRDPGWSASYR